MKGFQRKWRRLVLVLVGVMAALPMQAQIDDKYKDYREVYRDTVTMDPLESGRPQIVPRLPHPTVHELKCSLFPAVTRAHCFLNISNTLYSFSSQTAISSVSCFLFM